jgi:hypothetical protein
MALARTILFVILALVVGAIGYQIGVSQNLAALPAASGAPVAYYAPHMFGWGWGFGFPFLGFLFPLLFFFLFVSLIAAAFRGGRGWSGGYGHDWRRQRLEEIHRELHGEKPPATDQRT